MQQHVDDADDIILFACLIANYSLWFVLSNYMSIFSCKRLMELKNSCKSNHKFVIFF